MNDLPWSFSLAIVHAWRQDGRLKRTACGIKIYKKNHTTNMTLDKRSVSCKRCKKVLEGESKCQTSNVKKSTSS